MGLIGIFFSSFIIAFSGAMMPGPMFTATVLHSSKKGLRAGIFIVMGHGTLEVLLVMGLYFGLGHFLKSNTALAIIGISGGIVLLGMAYGAFRYSGDLLTYNKDTKSNSAYISGILTSLSNPYLLIWWITIGLSYIVLSFKYGLKGIVVFYMGHILADLAWYSVVALFFGYIKRFIGSKGFKVIMIISGFIFLSFALYFGWFGIKHTISID